MNKTNTKTLRANRQLEQQKAGEASLKLLQGGRLLEANNMKQSRLLAYKPPRIAIVLLAISIGLWFFSPPQTLFYIPYILIAGLSIIFGSTVVTWAWFQFKKSDTAVCPTSRTSRIVTNGVYKYSRNPMYLGFLFMLIGGSFLMGTMPSMFAPIVFFIIIDKVFIPYEEEKLLSAFGDEYSNYQRVTRRWL
jgi:protein-S-isoprenylcysteine O-methyltransferase Ste14